MRPVRHQYSDNAKCDLADIRAMPRAGVLRSEFRPDCRFVVERPYLIYYDFDGQRVLILRIIHGARDRDAIMGNDA